MSNEIVQFPSVLPLANASSGCPLRLAGAAETPSPDVPNTSSIRALRLTGSSEPPPSIVPSSERKEICSLPQEDLVYTTDSKDVVDEVAAQTQDCVSKSNALDDLPCYPVPPAQVHANLLQRILSPLKARFKRIIWRGRVKTIRTELGPLEALNRDDLTACFMSRKYERHIRVEVPLENGQHATRIAHALFDWHCQHNLMGPSFNDLFTGVKYGTDERIAYARTPAGKAYSRLSFVGRWGSLDPDLDSRFNTALFRVMEHDIGCDIVIGRRQILELGLFSDEGHLRPAVPATSYHAPYPGYDSMSTSNTRHRMPHANSRGYRTQREWSRQSS